MISYPTVHKKQRLKSKNECRCSNSNSHPAESLTDPVHMPIVSFGQTLYTLHTNSPFLNVFANE